MDDQFDQWQQAEVVQPQAATATVVPGDRNQNNLMHDNNNGNDGDMAENMDGPSTNNPNLQDKHDNQENIVGKNISTNSHHNHNHNDENNNNNNHNNYSTHDNLNDENAPANINISEDSGQIHLDDIANNQSNIINSATTDTYHESVYSQATAVKMHTTVQGDNQDRQLVSNNSGTYQQQQVQQQFDQFQQYAPVGEPVLTNPPLPEDMPQAVQSGIQQEVQRADQAIDAMNSSPAHNHIQNTINENNHYQHNDSHNANNDDNINPNIHLSIASDDANLPNNVNSTLLHNDAKMNENIKNNEQEQDQFGQYQQINSNAQPQPPKTHQLSQPSVPEPVEQPALVSVAHSPRQVQLQDTSAQVQHKQQEQHPATVQPVQPVQPVQEVGSPKLDFSYKRPQIKVQKKIYSEQDIAKSNALISKVPDYSYITNTYFMSES